MYDKAGYYICWVSLVLIPSFYTLSSYHLVSYKGANYVNSKILLFTGILGILLTYCIDYQKKLFRKTNGKCIIFGKKPKYLRVFYIDKHDRCNANKFLLGGFWCISKHFNYVTELITAYSWCLCCSNSIHTYMYPMFLTIFLIHRAERDSQRCNNKYLNWHRYCEIIKYKMIPGIY
jgi:7-dehydrocholesterol reductase